ncbi:MAG TPA: hypothetical protein VGE31_00720 [Candidatus Paceibacterota bacterium]
MNFVRPPTRGTIDETLSFFVASFQLSHAALTNLPPWVQQYVPVFRYGGLPIKEDGSDRESKRRLPQYSEIEESVGIDFLGTRCRPLERVSALGLENQLSQQGFAPSHFSIYIRRVRRDVPVYRLNIYWNRRPLDPTEESYRRTWECLELFQELQLPFSWSICGSEFKNHSKGYRCIVLDFRDRQALVPSLRYGNVTIKDNQIVAW